MSGSSTNNQSGYPTDNSDFNALDFHIRQVLSEANFARTVKVVACTNAGGVAAIGTVDVLPLVNGVDGQGNPTKHGQLNGLPYARVQCGGNAVIMDPAVGDVGVAVFADRDSSGVTAAGGQVNPGSFRKNDWADGFYLFASYGSGAPTQYVQFSAAGISIVSPTALMITAPLTTINGALNVTGDVTAGEGGADQVDIVNHTHKLLDVQSGSGTLTTTPPVAGT